MIKTVNIQSLIDVQYIVRYNRIGGDDMIALNYSQLRDNMKTYLDKVTEDFETLFITRKENKNVVVLSEKTYNNMLENMYLMGEKANYDWLMESKNQYESGKLERHELIDE